MSATTLFLERNCDGGGPHLGLAEVRTYPLGGGANLILCRGCFTHENAYRRERARQFRNPESWPTVEWDSAEVYSTAELQGVA